MPLPSKLWAAGLVSGVAFVVLLAGCDDPASTSSVTSTSAVGSTARPSTTAGTGTLPPGTSATTTPTAADRQVTATTGFTSPTGNIGCYISPESVRCDIGDRDWEPPPKPADCDLDYGQGIALAAGGSPRIVCAGDTARARGTDPLPYGQSIQAGSMRCDSSESGMSCRDVETGRGFTISREDYTFF
ncbi:MAG: hypothetical protein QOG82_2855 [Actinomycetota bacterium]|nr:hypothetical protein [Actinomycetota bacterium]